MMGGVIFEGFGAALSRPAGTVLTMSVSRSGAGSAAPTGLPANLLASVLIALGGFALLAAAVLFFFMRRHPAAPPADRALQAFIVEQIAELDALYEQGKIDPAAYQERRD